MSGTQDNDFHPSSLDGFSPGPTGVSSKVSCAWPFGAAGAAPSRRSIPDPEFRPAEANRACAFRFLRRRDVNGIGGNGHLRNMSAKRDSVTVHEVDEGVTGLAFKKNETGELHSQRATSSRPTVRLLVVGRILTPIAPSSGRCQRTSPAKFQEVPTVDFIPLLSRICYYRPTRNPIGPVMIRAYRRPALFQLR